MIIALGIDLTTAVFVLSLDFSPCTCTPLDFGTLDETSVRGRACHGSAHAVILVVTSPDLLPSAQLTQSSSLAVFAHGF